MPRFKVGARGARGHRDKRGTAAAPPSVRACVRDGGNHADHATIAVATVAPSAVWLLHQFGRHVLDRVSRGMFRVFVLLMLLAVLALMWIEI